MKNRIKELFEKENVSTKFTDEEKDSIRFVLSYAVLHHGLIEPHRLEEYVDKVFSLLDKFASHAFLAGRVSSYRVAFEIALNWHITGLINGLVEIPFEDTEDLDEA